MRFCSVVVLTSGGFSSGVRSWIHGRVTSVVIFHSGRRMRLPSLSFPVATGTLRGSSATKKRAEVNIELIWSL